MSPIGIGNLGNTCSINTCLQCIFAIPSLGTIFLDAHFQEESLGHELQRVLNAMTDASSSSETYVVQPSKFISLLRREAGCMFPQGDQHDLCELWVWILNHMHDISCMKRASPPKGCDIIEKGILTEMHRFQDGKYSRFLDVLQGSQIAMVMCHRCGYRASNVEPLTVIPLDIRPELSLLDMLKEYLNPTALHDWTCDKCKHKGASRMVRFYHCPKVLVVSLNRFVMNQDGAMEKNACPVRVPPSICFHAGAVISVSPDGPPITYKLRASGNHFGKYGGGHYTATVSRPEGWFHMDDISIEPYDGEKEALKHINGCSYMLFYERCD